MWKSPKYHAFEGFFVGNARLGVWGGHIVIDKSGAWNVDNVTGFNNLVKIPLLQTATTLTLKMVLWDPSDLVLQLPDNYLYECRKNIIFQLHSIPFTLSANVLL